MKSLHGLLCCLFIDLKRHHPDVVGLDRDLLTIEARIKDEGVGFLATALPAFGKAFDLSLAHGKMAHIPGFARNGSLPKLFSGLTSLVFCAKTGHLLDNPRHDCILTVRQVCYLFKKFLPDGSRLENLDYSTKKAFADVDASIGTVAPFRLDALRRVCSFILGDLDEFTELKCKHGPGAVFEGYTPNQKWSEVYRGLLEFDHRLMYAGYDLPAGILADDLPMYNPIEDHPSTGVARLVTVHKSFSALRTITVEPCLNQFVQQGYNAWLRSCIARDRVLRQSLELTDQKPNQELALIGSRTGEWCTIDLSSASDLLSLQTVETVFADRPRFLKGILGCRTPEVDCGYTKIHLKKYAGMGNATTFPVQSVVFAMIAITAILGSTKELSYEKVERAGRNVRVFGDDIIVRSEHFRDVADWITCFGLKINRSKTFSEGNFRESCGVDAFGGTEVTPVYLRHDPGQLCSDPSPVESLVSVSNQLWLRCYYQSSEFLRNSVEASFGRLPLVRRSSAGLGWNARFDEYEVQRWNPMLHRFEVRTVVPIPVRRLDILSDIPALLKFFHKPSETEMDRTHLKVSVRRFRKGLRRRWVQA